MPAYEYEALDLSGKKQKGLLSADSETAARRELRRRQMAPLKLARADRQTSSRSAFSLRSQPRLGARDLMGFTRQLSTLIGAGMPVEEAVGLLANQAQSTPVRRVLMAVRGRITEGERMSVAMSEHPESFSPVYRSMVAAGEGAGGLHQVLDRLADYLEKSEALKNKIGVALIYPGVLAGVAFLVIGILMVFVVPRLAEQFSTMGETLPFLTVAMIGLSEFLQASWLYILIAIGLVAVILPFLMRRPAIRQARDSIVLRLPVLAGFSRRIESARFARTMAILISAGAVLPDALRASRKASGNTRFQSLMDKVIDQVEQGTGLSDALKAADWFPPLMLYMIAAGERSGRLDEMFNRAADHLEGEVDTAITTGLSLLEPGIILLMGGVVVLIVLSILLPILRLNTLALG